jgi:hypothetical protein
VQHDALPAERSTLEVERLARDTFYVFALRAKTALGWGEAAEVQVRTIVDRRKYTILQVSILYIIKLSAYCT